MTMPGGGTWSLAPGQITDDSELAMCQLRGLVAGNGKFDAFQIARYYGYWIYTGPFDCGRTTAQGLGPLAKCRDNPDPQVSYKAAAKGYAATSLSNGSLMRATPLAVWSQNLNLSELQQAVTGDVRFMHSLPAMTNIVTAYCIVVGTLIRNAGEDNRATLALEAVEEYASRREVDTCVAQWITVAKNIAELMTSEDR